MYVFKQKCALIRKSLSVLMAIALFPLIGYAQGLTVSCLDSLASNNGFKEIKLGADLARIPNSRFDFLDGDKSPDADSCIKFEYKAKKALELNNGVQLNLVGFRAYHNKVINVYLFFNREDGYKMLHDFVHLYGKYTDRPADFVYEWRSDIVNVSLFYRPCTDLGVAIFTYNKIEDNLALLREKAKKPMQLSQVSVRSLQ